MVKQETSRFCTNALKKVNERKKEMEKKHKEMMEEEEVTKHKRPPEEEQQYGHKLDPDFVFREDEDKEDEEPKDKGDMGGKEEKQAHNRDNGPFDTSIPQEMTTPPGTCELEGGDPAKESSKAMDESESPEVGISQQVIEMVENDDRKVTTEEEGKEEKKEKEMEIGKEEVPKKEYWREAENKDNAAKPVDKVVFSPPDKLAKVS